MTRYYHERFFSDVRYTSTLVVGLLVVGWWQVPEAFLLVPVVALLGANQTAFDASYLIFARQYAAVLESDLNSSLRKSVLVAAEMEDRYLFPLDKPKIVTARFGADFSWFGWVTLLYTALGLLAGAGGLALGWSTLNDAGAAWTFFYVGSLGSLLAISAVLGGWWFIGGAGEKRLRDVFAESYGQPTKRNNNSG